MVLNSKIPKFLCSVFTVLGTWKPYNRSKTIQKAYNIYAVIILFSIIFLYGFLMVCNLMLIDDMSDLTDRLFMTVQQIGSNVKMIYIFINNKRFQQLLASVKHFEIETPAEEQLMERRMNFFGKVVFWYFFIPVSGINMMNLKAAMERTLTYSSWYPELDWRNNSRDYSIAYTHDSIGTDANCFLNVAMDSYYCFIMYMIATELLILGMRLNNMDFGIPDVFLHSNHNETALLSHKSHSSLVNCIRLHQEIIDLTKSIKMCMIWSYLPQVMLSALIICAITNEIALVTIVTNREMCRLENILTSPFNFEEIFGSRVCGFTNINSIIICNGNLVAMQFRAEEIITQNTLMSNQLYKSDWLKFISTIDGGKRDCLRRKTFIFFMEKLKQDEQILIGKLFPLGMNVFSAVSNSPPN